MSRQGMVSEMEALQNSVLEMAKLATGMLHEGTQALEELDQAKAHEVISRTERLAELDEEIETGLLSFLALQSPMAGDLRRVGTALKLITYINRIGRYGYDIAKVTDAWPTGSKHVAKMVDLREMSSKVLAMMDIVVGAFKENATPDVGALTKLEDDVNALRYGVWRQCLSYMDESKSNIERCAHYMMVARYLERCGDNVCKMAEKQHYAATGKRIFI
jgi:phosphate transport system protein